MRSLVSGHKLKSRRFNPNGAASKDATTESANSRTIVARTVAPNSAPVNALDTYVISTLNNAPTRGSTSSTLPKPRSGTASSTAAMTTTKINFLYGGGGRDCGEGWGGRRFG